MAKMVMAAFSNRNDADAAVNALADHGYSAEDISVITRENQDEAGDIVSDTAEGAVGGATTGGVVGGIAGLLAGAGVIPALAGLFIGGPIAVALGATGLAATTISGAVTGAAAGGLIGALTGLGLSEDVAQSYDETIQAGGYILAVPAREGDDDPRALLADYNASDITEVTLKS